MVCCVCRVAEHVFDYSSHYDHLMEAAQEMGQVSALVTAQAYCLWSPSGQAGCTTALVLDPLEVASCCVHGENIGQGLKP